MVECFVFISKFSFFFFNPCFLWIKRYWLHCFIFSYGLWVIGLVIWVHTTEDFRERQRDPRGQSACTVPSALGLHGHHIEEDAAVLGGYDGKLGHQDIQGWMWACGVGENWSYSVACMGDYSRHCHTDMFCVVICRLSFYSEVSGI